MAVVDLLAAVAVFTPVASVVAGTLQAELGRAEVASVLAECAPHAVFRTLRARDRASLRLVVHHIGRRSLAVLWNKFRVLLSPGSRTSTFQTFAATSWRGTMRTGTATGTGGTLTLITVASLSLSADFGAD